LEEVRATRAELLERRIQISLASQGMDLLKRKRDALLLEFMGCMDETLRLSAELEARVAEAQYGLAVAEAVDGAVALRSAGMATTGAVDVDVRGTKIMGVPLPVVEKALSPLRTSITRGYAMTGVSSRIDETADRFERVVDLIIDYAGVETRLRRLGQEIQRTSRRVNALEQVALPQLREQVAFVKMALDERAREDLFRLKKVKAKIAKKKAGDTLGDSSARDGANPGVQAGRDAQEAAS
jgi:V/A-type H+/Na+-transporting ATPase subunit D